jgi:hypothetical protein
MKFVKRMRACLLRRRLASIAQDIEVIERGRAVMAADLDRLIRAAVSTRADLWHLENPRTSGGHLRSLSSPLVRRAELRQVVRRAAS